jgi:murein DD-endopeptidase MepM/ murein hydrolase activator NlpD
MRRPRALRVVPVLAVALVLGSLLLPTTAQADRQADIQKRIQQLRDQVGEASADETALLDQIATAQVNREALDGVIADYDTQIGDVSAQLAAAEAHVNDLGLQVDQLTLQLIDTEARTIKTQGQLEDAALNLYVGHETPALDAYIGAFETAGSPSELAAARLYLQAVAGDDTALIDRLAVDHQDTDDVRHQIDAAKAEAEEAADAVDQERQRLQGLRDDQAKVRDQVVAEQKKEQSALATLQANVKTWKSQIDSLQAESDAITKFLAGLQANQSSLPQSGSHQLHRPVPGAITSGFGSRLHPILGYTRPHTGVDMHASAGTPIEAAASGTVVMAGWNGGYGNCVIIDHGNGLATLYGHQSRLAVSVGDHVSTGQVIGYVGSTGLATGPHLHFEVRKFGTPVDPTPYL